MKKIVKYALTALLMLGCMMSITACNDYDECPPLNEGYLTTYIIPSGVFLSDAEWEEIESEEAEYEEFLKTVITVSASVE